MYFNLCVFFVLFHQVMQLTSDQEMVLYLDGKSYAEGVGVFQHVCLLRCQVLQLTSDQEMVLYLDGKSYAEGAGVFQHVCLLRCQVLQQTSDQEMVLYSDVKEQSHPVAQVMILSLSSQPVDSDDRRTMTAADAGRSTLSVSFVSCGT